MKPVPVPVAPTDENQAADLAALAANAQTGEAPAGAPGSEQQIQEQKAPMNLAKEFEMGIQFFRSFFSPIFPSLKTIYTDEVVLMVSGSVAEVCNKHNWLQDGFLGPYKEEIGCAVVVLPLALATYQGIKGDIASMQAKKDAQDHAKIDQAQVQAQQVSSGD